MLPKPIYYRYDSSHLKYKKQNTSNLSVAVLHTFISFNITKSDEIFNHMLNGKFMKLSNRQKQSGEDDKK